MNILDQIVLEKKNFIKYLKQKELHAIKIPKKQTAPKSFRKDTFRHSVDLYVSDTYLYKNRQYNLTFLKNLVTARVF